MQERNLLEKHMKGKRPDGGHQMHAWHLTSSRPSQLTRVLLHDIRFTLSTHNISNVHTRSEQASTFLGSINAYSFRKRPINRFS